MSFEALRAKKRDIEDYIKAREEQKAHLEKVLAEAPSVAHVIAIRQEIAKLDEQIEAARKELAAVDEALGRIRSEVAAQKSRTVANAKRAASEAEKALDEVLAKLDALIGAFDSLDAKMREFVNAVGEASRASEVLGEPLVPATRIDESLKSEAAWYRRLVAEVRERLKGRYG